MLFKKVFYVWFRDHIERMEIFTDVIRKRVAKVSKKQKSKDNTSESKV